MQQTDAALLERIRAGKLIEGPEQAELATERYIEGLKRTLIVSGDTELISAPSYLRAARDAPKINSYVSAISIIQDELGHAHIAYRLLSDLGVDTLSGMAPRARPYRRQAHNLKDPSVEELAAKGNSTAAAPHPR